MARPTGLVAAVVVAVALAILWAFPPVAFPNPGTNDAIWLSNLELALLLLGGFGLTAAVVRSGPRRAVICAGLGVFVIGSAAALLLGFAVFGNNSNDRFLPLLFLPPLIAGPGFLLILIGLVLRRDRDLLRAGALGVLAAALVAAWVLLRGSRDWLLAPYGFDEIAVILVLGAALPTAVRPVTRG